MRWRAGAGPALLAAGAPALRGAQPLDRIASAAYRTVGALLPLALWSGYYATLGVTAGIGWWLEMWTGMIVHNAFAGMLVAQLLLPLPAVHRSATAPVPRRWGSGGTRRGMMAPP